MNNAQRDAQFAALVARYRETPYDMIPEPKILANKLRKRLLLISTVLTLVGVSLFIWTSRIKSPPDSVIIFGGLVLGLGVCGMIGYSLAIALCQYPSKEEICKRIGEVNRLQQAEREAAQRARAALEREKELMERAPDTVRELLKIMAIVKDHDQDRTPTCRWPQEKAVCGIVEWVGHSWQQTTEGGILILKGHSDKYGRNILRISRVSDMEYILRRIVVTEMRRGVGSDVSDGPHEIEDISVTSWHTMYP